MNWIARTLFGLSADEIRSLRSQNAQLQTRLEMMVEEREDARKKLDKALDQIVEFSKHAIDGMLVNNGSLPWFGVGPALKEQPDVDWSKIAGGRTARIVERKNREFLKSHDIVPNSGWNDLPEEIEQAS